MTLGRRGRGNQGCWEATASSVSRQRSGADASRLPPKARQKKGRAVLAAKRRLSSSAWELRWTLDELLSFAPGPVRSVPGCRARVARLLDRRRGRSRADAPCEHPDRRLRLPVRGEGGRGAGNAHGASPRGVPTRGQQQAPRVRGHRDRARSSPTHDGGASAPVREARAPALRQRHAVRVLPALPPNTGPRA